MNGFGFGGKSLSPNKNFEILGLYKEVESFLSSNSLLSLPTKVTLFLPFIIRSFCFEFGFLSHVTSDSSLEEPVYQNVDRGRSTIVDHRPEALVNRDWLTVDRPER